MVRGESRSDRLKRITTTTSQHRDRGIAARMTFCYLEKNVRECVVETYYICEDIVKVVTESEAAWKNVDGAIVGTSRTA